MSTLTGKARRASSGFLRQFPQGFLLAVWAPSVPRLLLQKGQYPEKRQRKQEHDVRCPTKEAQAGESLPSGGPTLPFAPTS